MLKAHRERTRSLKAALQNYVNRISLGPIYKISTEVAQGSPNFLTQF